MLTGQKLERREAAGERRKPFYIAGRVCSVCTSPTDFLRFEASFCWRRRVAPIPTRLNVSLDLHKGANESCQAILLTATIRGLPLPRRSTTRAVPLRSLRPLSSTSPLLSPHRSRLILHCLGRAMEKITDKIAALPPDANYFSLEFFPPKTQMVGLSLLAPHFFLEAGKFANQHVS